jgi:hypothetical protein
VPYVVFIGGVRIYEAWPGNPRKGGAGLGEVRLGKEPYSILTGRIRIDTAGSGGQRRYSDGQVSAWLGEEPWFIFIDEPRIDEARNGVARTGGARQCMVLSGKVFCFGFNNFWRIENAVRN